MDKIGLLLLLAGCLGLVLSVRRLGRRDQARGLNRNFDFSHYKKIERYR